MLFLCVANPSCELSRFVTIALFTFVKLEFSTSTCAPMRELIPEVGTFS
jgi:hypothetical protein